MSLISSTFFLACTGALAIYYLVPRAYRWISLLLASLVVYCLLAPPWTFAYVVIAALAAWGAALCFDDETTARTTRNSRVLHCSLFCLIGLLAVLKYLPFLCRNFNVVWRCLSQGNAVCIPELVSSLGVSYYTFQLVSYVMDCYWGMQEPQKNFFKFLLFACYFPQMLLGPISRYSELGGALTGGNAFDYKKFTFGLQRIVWGVFKKLVVAERLSPIVKSLFDDPDKYCGPFVWYASVLFLLQLYADFSGCIDILGGVSECFGIKLPDNFRTPFFSKSVQEFWQRWHITLGGWMRDYVFYPLLKSSTWRRLTKWLNARVGKKHGRNLATYLAMACLWLCMGVWHGGDWKYVIGFGCWFFFCIVLAKVCDPFFEAIYRNLSIDRESRVNSLIRMFVTFNLAALGQVFFRAKDLGSALSMFGNMITKFPPSEVLHARSLYVGLSQTEFCVAMLGVLIVIGVMMIQEWQGSVRAIIARTKWPVKWGLYYLLIFSVIVFGVYGPGVDPTEFIYANF